jgi:hypothetical protein
MSQYREKDGGAKLDPLGDRGRRRNDGNRVEVSSRDTVVRPKRVEPDFLCFRREPRDKFGGYLGRCLNEADTDLLHNCLVHIKTVLSTRTFR